MLLSRSEAGKWGNEGRRGEGRNERASQGEGEKEGDQRQEAWPGVGNALSLTQAAPEATSSGSWAADGFLKQQQQLPMT